MIEFNKEKFVASLKAAVKNAGGNDKVSELTGISTVNISRYVTSRTMPSAEMLARIATACSVSVDKLFFGDGNLKPLGASQSETSTFKYQYGKQNLVSSYDPDEESTGGFSSEGWKPSVSGARPEIDVRLGAGEGIVGEMVTIPSNGSTTGHKVVAEWLLPQEFLVGVVEANASQTVVMEVVGDSMEPTYHSGDRVMVDLGQSRMVADIVYAISYGFSEPQIKRLQRIPFLIRQK